jgi:hypothetical protein
VVPVGLGDNDWLLDCVVLGVCDAVRDCVWDADDVPDRVCVIVRDGVWLTDWL